MRNGLTLLCFLCLSSFLAQAQSNFKPGFAITHKGDTLKGWINQKEWLTSPSELVFKANDTTGAEQKLTPATCKYIEILGAEAFVSETVSISMNAINLSNLPVGPELIFTEKNVFLEVIYKGQSVSLLSYTDKIKTRLYLHEKLETAQPQELLNRQYYSSGQKSKIVKDPIYRNQLWNNALKHKMNTEALLTKIKKTAYHSTSIASLVQHIDGNPLSQPSDTIRQLPRTRLVAGLWLNRMTMKQTGDGSFFASGAKYPVSYAPRASIGLDFFAAPNTRRFLIRTELSATMAKTHVTNEVKLPSVSMTYFYEYEFEQLSVSVNPQVLFHIYNGKKLKAHLAAGFMGTYASYSQDRLSLTNYMVPGNPVSYKTEQDFEQPKSMLYSITARAGLVLSNNLDFSVLYTSNNISNRVHYSIQTSSFNTGLTYLFN